MKKIASGALLLFGLINAAGSASDYNSFGQIARAAQRLMRNPASDPNSAELLVRTEELIAAKMPVKVSHLALCKKFKRVPDLAEIRDLIVNHALATKAKHLRNRFKAALDGTIDEPRDSDSSATEGGFDSDSSSSEDSSDSGSAGSDDGGSGAKRICED